MSNDVMDFPDTWEEFEQIYGFIDKEEIYTNGSRLIPSFRVKQWLDHIEEKKHEENIQEPYYPTNYAYYCSSCKQTFYYPVLLCRCPNCGNRLL